MSYEKLEEALFSNEYPCPGGHRKDGVRGDWQDHEEEMMDTLGFPVEWKADELSMEHPEEYKKLRTAMAQNWVEERQCPEKIEVTLEFEGEYGSYSYLVAEGPCVEVLGLDEDAYESGFWGPVFERRRLRKLWPAPSYTVEDFVRREEARVS